MSIHLPCASLLPCSIPTSFWSPYLHRSKWDRREQRIQSCKERQKQSFVFLWEAPPPPHGFSQDRGGRAGMSHEHPWDGRGSTGPPESEDCLKNVYALEISGVPRKEQGQGRGDQEIAQQVAGCAQSIVAACNPRCHLDAKRDEASRKKIWLEPACIIISHSFGEPSLSWSSKSLVRFVWRHLSALSKNLAMAFNFKCKRLRVLCPSVPHWNKDLQEMTVGLQACLDWQKPDAWGQEEELLSEENAASSGMPTNVHNTIENSRITFHHFIFRELFLVIISSWFTSKNSGRIISRNLSDLHLLPHLFFASDICNHYIRNSGGINFRKDFMGITSKYSGGINFVIQAFRMVYKQTKKDALGAIYMSGVRNIFEQT